MIAIVVFDLFTYLSHVDKGLNVTVQIKSYRNLNDAGKLLNNNEGCLVRL